MSGSCECLTSAAVNHRKGCFLVVIAYVSLMLLWQLTGRSSFYEGMLGTSSTVEVEKIVKNWDHLVSSNITRARVTVDIHVDDMLLGHTGEIQGLNLTEEHAHDISNITVAIGGGITSAKIIGVTPDNIRSKFPAFKHLIPSFCRTASPGYLYHFYLAYDYSDPYFSDDTNLEEFLTTAYAMFREMCEGMEVSVHMVQCSHTHNPAWAQNDAMMEAYLDNMEFYYRLNDDSTMLTGQWLETFISVLYSYSPPLVGVVGPTHSGGNTHILTYDFVHRTHVDIFGFYYPRTFTDWWADNWVTEIYKPHRYTKLKSITLKHTMELGQRYRHHPEDSKKLKGQLANDNKTLQRYLQYRKELVNNTSTTPQTTKVISMSLFGKDPRYTWGAIRNAQLAPMLLPDWTLRVYTPDPRELPLDSDMLVPYRVLAKLKVLGAQIAYVNPNKVRLPPRLWRLLVAEDASVDHFVVRDADTRIRDRDAGVYQFWVESGYPFLVVKDHPSHVDSPVVEGLWGARTQILAVLIGQNLYSYLQKVFLAQQSSRPGLLGRLSGLLRQLDASYQYLTPYLWSKVKHYALCLDSVSCTEWTACHPFPAASSEHNNEEYMGRKYSENQTPYTKDRFSRVPECCNHKLKPEDLPQTAVDWLMFRQSTTRPTTTTTTVPSLFVDNQGSQAQEVFTEGTQHLQSEHDKDQTVNTTDSKYLVGRRNGTKIEDNNVKENVHNVNSTSNTTSSEENGHS